MHCVFISYANPDYQIAKKIEVEINDRLHLSFDARLVEDRKEGDTTFTEKVIEYFKLCNIFIVLLTKDSLNNQFVNQEWGYAKCLKEYGQIQMLLHITQVCQKKRIESSGFISTNMDSIPLQYDDNGHKIDKMISELLDFLREKESSLRPVLTEKQNKLGRYLNEINNNIDLQSELISKKQGFINDLAMNPLKFRYDYALQIIGIGHYFSNEFIEKAVSYVDVLNELNIRKDMVIDWAISRGRFHGPSTQDFYDMLKKNVKGFESIKKIIQEEYRIFT